MRDKFLGFLKVAICSVVTIYVIFFGFKKFMTDPLRHTTNLLMLAAMIFGALVILGLAIQVFLFVYKIVRFFFEQLGKIIHKIRCIFNPELKYKVKKKDEFFYKMIMEKYASVPKNTPIVLDEVDQEIFRRIK